MKANMENDCTFCDNPSSATYGIATYEGKIVPHDWPGDWVGVPACEDCWAGNEKRNIDRILKQYWEKLSP
jgi:hypothetical protein